jgi:hypothetical protein
MTQSLHDPLKIFRYSGWQEEEEHDARVHNVDDVFIFFRLPIARALTRRLQHEIFLKTDLNSETEFFSSPFFLH